MFKTSPPDGARASSKRMMNTFVMLFEVFCRRKLGLGGNTLGRTSRNPMHDSTYSSSAAPCRFLDSLDSRNHRSDSSSGPLRGFHFILCCGNGNLESLLQSSRGNAPQRHSHAVRTDFSFRLSLFFCGRELALLCSLGEFQLACHSGQTLLGDLCSRQRRQTNRFLASQLAFLRRTTPVTGSRCRRLLFRDRLPVCWADAQQTRHPRQAFRLPGLARRPAQFLRSLNCRRQIRAPVRPVPADGKMATPVPRDSCTLFCEAPILAKIRGPAPNRARGVVCRGGNGLAFKLFSAGTNRAWTK
jgi:hypothetical protein